MRKNGVLLLCKCALLCFLVNINALFKVFFQLCKGNAFLLHCVAITHRHAAVVFRVEVNGNAVRRTDFVLTAVTLADTACFVVVAGKFLKQIGVNFRCLVAEFL